MRVIRSVVAIAMLSVLPQMAAAQIADDAMSLGIVRTEAERAVVRLAVNVLKDINLSTPQVNEPNWLLFFTPEVDLVTGADDAFSSITAKIAATYIRFDTVVVEGIVTPRSDFFQMVPIAVGVEANRDFNTLNGIAEVGYIPWFQGMAPPLLKSLRLGVFLQAGYKFERDSVRRGVDDGMPDESDELAEDALARIKASGRWSPRINLTESNLALVTSADAWFDILNTAFYYRLEGTVRLKLFADHFLDLTWERGAGAPNFNQGSQFSANLTVNY